MSQQHSAGSASAAAAPAARRPSLPNPADDASDLIVDWNHRHRASVTYDGEEEEEEDDDGGDDNGGDVTNEHVTNGTAHSDAAEARGQAQTTTTTTTTTSTGPTRRQSATMSRRRRSGTGGGTAPSGPSTIIDDPLIVRPPPQRSGNGTNINADNNHGRQQPRETSTSGSGRESERESLFDRIGALAAAATATSAASAGSAPVSDRPVAATPITSSSSRGANNPNVSTSSSVPAPGTAESASSEQRPEPQHPPSAAANTNTTNTPTNNTARRTVRFQQHNRILVVEGRHHYTPRETSATWYDADDATAMRQTYTSDVRAMRRRIRRNVALDLHTYEVHGGDYSERGLEHLVSTAVYQERTDDQAGTIQAVLAAQENFNARGNGGGGDDPTSSNRRRRAQGEGTGDAPSVVGDSSGGYTDQLARMYIEMSLGTRERAEELGRADAEEAAVLWDAAEDEGRARPGGRRGSSDGRGNVGGGHNRT